jgi:NADPH-dependent ferric siderophore reductase
MSEREIKMLAVIEAAKELAEAHHEAFLAAPSRENRDKARKASYAVLDWIARYRAEFLSRG